MEHKNAVPKGWRPNSLPFSKRSKAKLMALHVAKGKRQPAPPMPCSAHCWQIVVERQL
eukprot:CAMPEP_0172878012 /NCGR_PEP_ID=MMETSP1075-20121228/108477_1 /TAXON_ID=2916 /ORGANISM="Ceratium fusus, Strain PA161109" /LENGTH=57 /DNA_ID=CAMNT_0013729695 /DNA_START=227 /DNA_END=400 /DNA_ORIENTATION=+